MLTRRPHTRYACALLLAGLWFGLASTPAEAAACYSVVNGNWSTASTWSSISGGNPVDNPCGGGPSNIPGAGDDAVIERGFTVTVNVLSAALSVTVNAPSSNGTTTLNVGNNTLNVTGSVTIAGGGGQKKAELSFGTGTLRVGNTITNSGGASVILAWGTGTVEYNGTGNQSVGAYNYYNLTISKSTGTATTSGNITLGNNLTVTSGTLDLASNTANRGTTGGTLELADGTLLRLSSGNFPANYTNETIGATNTTEYYGSGNLSVPNKLYGHLLLSGSANRNLPNTALTVAGDFTTTGTVAAVTNASLIINGSMSIGVGTSFDAKTFSSHAVKGNFSNNGTFTRGTSTFTFNGTAAQTIGGAAATAFHHLVINNTGSGTTTTSVNLSISGNFTNTNGFNAGATTTTFNGTAAQTLGGVTTTFSSLTMNNAIGLTLNADVIVGGILTFTAGKITTGTTTSSEPYTKKLTTTVPCGSGNNVVGAGQTTGWVVGNLQRAVPAVPTGSLTCPFPVGGTAYYSPIVVEFPAGTTAGNLTGAAMPYSTAPSGHPNITTSDINPDRNVNRFWTLKDNTVGFTSYNATFTFDTADVDATADPLDFVIRRYSPPYPAAGSWSNATGGVLTDTSSQGLGITGADNFDFAIGNSTVSAFLREREWVYQRELYYQ